MQEQLGNLGYLAILDEANKGVVAGIPNVYVPIYDESLSTNANFQDQDPIYSGKFGRYATLQGQRDHQGDVTILAEGNSLARFAKILVTKESSTGTGPATHVYGFSKTDNPISQTWDISTNNVVKRFWGVQASSFSPDWSANEMRGKIKISALGSFQGRSIATVSGNTITLSTKYDQAPTKGLFIGDLVRIYKVSDRSTANFTVSTIAGDGITLTLNSTAAAFGAGDMIHLRPVTSPVFDLLPTFLWAKTQFRFGATASAALTATQTQVESGSTYEVIHPFEDDGGAKRSGSFDPAALVRLAGDATLTIKKFFDTPEEIKKYNDMDKSALVVRHFAGDANQYELRVTFHNITTDSPVANISSNSINYANLRYPVNYDPTDGRAVTVTIINNVVAP